jgi:hypothetical protein
LLPNCLRFFMSSRMRILAKFKRALMPCEIGTLTTGGPHSSFEPGRHTKANISPLTCSTWIS